MSSVATVLVVEDEFAIADLLEMVLVDQGHRVLVASNGHQALERLVEGPRPDLIISDFMMPVMDGARMIQAMRADEALRDIPCIVISSMPEARVRERLDGYTAFIRKPFRIALIVELVATILGAARVA